MRTVAMRVLQSEHDPAYTVFLPRGIVQASYALPPTSASPTSVMVKAIIFVRTCED